MRRGLAIVLPALIVLCVGWFRVAANQSSGESMPPVVYTSAAQYEPEAWMKGAERFPVGAQVLVLDGSNTRPLLSGFAATADPAVSFDGSKVLFAGRKQAKDSWQIWESLLAGGEAKQLTHCAGDCVRPFYLPGGRIVFAAKVQGRFVLQSMETESGKTRQLSYAPGNAMPTDILRDGRILFEAVFPLGSGTSPEIYTVYSDGSGVEAYRCDHGPRRQAGKQSATGDIVFVSDKGVARFTSALAKQVEVRTPAGEFAGDAIPLTADVYLATWRPDSKARWSLQRWTLSTSSLSPVATADTNLLQPVLATPRPVPNLHPSGLHDWSYANLLCLNAYTSKTSIPAGSVASAKLYTLDEKGKPRLLGTSAVEKDGSFYVQVPGDKPLQIELLDAAGKTVQREHGWWWMAKGEQRICVGCHAGPERSPENAVPQVLVKSVKPVVMTGTATASKGAK